MLIAIAREQLGLDALRSAVVLFFNKDRTRCELLVPGIRGLARIPSQTLLPRILASPAPTIATATSRWGANVLGLAACRAGDRSVRIEARELGVLLAGIERR